MVTGQDVADFLGRGSDTQLVALAGEHVVIVNAMVRAYVRGKGYDALGEPADDVAAVITTATARLVVNPAQLDRESADGYSVSGSFHGFTLAELFVLNQYRKRAL
jgi:hypothetical protein